MPSHLRLPKLVDKFGQWMCGCSLCLPATNTLINDGCFFPCLSGDHLGSLQTQGLWSAEDLDLHISVRELKAVRLMCQVFLPHIKGNSLLVLTDNTAAMFSFNKLEEAPLFFALSRGNSALGDLLYQLNSSRSFFPTGSKTI